MRFTRERDLKKKIILRNSEYNTQTVQKKNPKNLEKLSASIIHQHLENKKQRERRVIREEKSEK
jgi:hypothetical protein